MIKHPRWAIRRSLLIMLTVWLALSLNTATASGLTSADIKSIVTGTEAYNPDFVTQCNVSSAASSGASTNVDYKGDKIFNDAQMTTISQNQPFYEAAAKQADIPWQMIAVIHIRESGGQRSNPGNGQGIYQFVDKHGGPYPAGPVSDDEFSRQTLLAAEFIKAKAGSNYQINRTLSASSSIEAIKDTFFSYNGRAAAYIAQAQSLGFNNLQGYEGSPYVMNLADARRDPDVAKLGTWGQIKTDGGSISYPANRGSYGAFVMYAALTGVSLVGNCSSTISGPTRDRVVALANQELQLWQSGKLKPGNNDYYKYSGGDAANWCAYFVSWIFNQAGDPLSSAKDGVVAAVVQVEQIGRQGSNFVWHDAEGYSPQPGDIAVHLANGASHVNIVVANDGDTFTLIGGNQGGGGFSNSSVTEYPVRGTTSDDITGFVSPK